MCVFREDEGEIEEEEEDEEEEEREEEEKEEEREEGSDSDVKSFMKKAELRETQERVVRENSKTISIINLTIINLNGS